MFADRNTWFDHELTVHRSIFRCRQCSLDFRSEADLSSHLTSEHSNWSPEQRLALMKYGRTVPPQLAAHECPFCDWDGYLRDTMGPPEGRHGASTTEPRKLFVSLARFKRHVADHQEKLAISSVSKWVATEEEGDEGIQSHASARILEDKDSEEYRVSSPRLPTTTSVGSKGSEGAETESYGQFDEPGNPQDVVPRMMRVSPNAEGQAAREAIPFEIQDFVKPFNEDDYFLFSQYLDFPSEETPAYVQPSVDGRGETSAYLGSEGQVSAASGLTQSSSSYSRASPSSPSRLEDAESQPVPIVSWPPGPGFEDLNYTDYLRHVHVSDHQDNNPVIISNSKLGSGKGEDLCQVDGCTGKHVHEMIDGISISSLYCQEHTCRSPRDDRRGFCATPRNPTQKCCPQHGKCTAPGCTRQAPRSIPRSELPFICPQRESYLNFSQCD